MNPDQTDPHPDDAPLGAGGVKALRRERERAAEANKRATAAEAEAAELRRKLRQHRSNDAELRHWKSRALVAEHDLKQAQREDRPRHTTPKEDHR